MNLKWTGERRTFLRVSPMKSPMAQIPPMKKGLLFFSNPLKSGGEGERRTLPVSIRIFCLFPAKLFFVPRGIPRKAFAGKTKSCLLFDTVPSCPKKFATALKTYRCKRDGCQFCRTLTGYILRLWQWLFSILRVRPG